MPDRVRCLKIETPTEGGTQDDINLYGGPVELDPGSDSLDAQGIFFQRPGSNINTADTKAFISRNTAGDMVLQDANQALLALSQLITSVSGRINSHNALPALEHFGSAPGDGFASGAYMTVSANGILPSNITWFASSAANANRLFSIDVVYKGIRPQTITQKLYANGQVVRTFVDTLSYTNVFFPTVTRTWT